MMTSPSELTQGDYKQLCGQVVEFYTSAIELMFEHGIKISIRMELLDIVTALKGAILLMTERGAFDGKPTDRLHPTDAEIFIKVKGMYERNHQHLITLTRKIDPLESVLEAAGIRLP